MHINKAEMSLMDISRFVNESKRERDYRNYIIETENYVLMKKELYDKIKDAKPAIHAHAIVDWLGNYKCSNCGNIDLNITEPYCQHCGARLDEPEEEGIIRVRGNLHIAVMQASHGFYKCIGGQTERNRDYRL